MCKREGTFLVLLRRWEVMLLAGTLSLDHLHFSDFLTCTDRLCSCYSHDRTNFCRSQKGVWPGPESFSITPPVIFWELEKWSPGLCAVVEGEVGCTGGFQVVSNCVQIVHLCTLCYSYSCCYFLVLTSLLFPVNCSSHNPWSAPWTSN